MAGVEESIDLALKHIYANQEAERLRVKIITLLRTDISFRTIAKRLDCSIWLISEVNRKSQIRPHRSNGFGCQ